MAPLGSTAGRRSSIIWEGTPQLCFPYLRLTL